MASKRQRDLDQLIESAGARVYDEEAGCWSDGSDDESGWGFSSLTRVVKRAVRAPMSIARRGLRTTRRLASMPTNLARRGYGMARGQGQGQGRGQEQEQTPANYPDQGAQQQEYPQQDSQQDPNQSYSDQNYPDQGQ